MEVKHSRKGIASFVTALLLWVPLLALLFMVLGCKEPPLLFIFLFRTSVLAFWLNPVALGLGIAGMLDKDRKHVFAVLGVVFSWLQIFTMTLFVVSGIKFSSH